MLVWSHQKLRKREKHNATKSYCSWLVCTLPLGHIWRMEALATMGRLFNPPFPPILSHHAPNWLSDGQDFKTSRTSEEKHVRENLRHSVTTHNWFVHYLWDIYGGFGHNGKIIQCTLPSHTQPSHSNYGNFTLLLATSLLLTFIQTLFTFTFTESTTISNLELQWPLKNWGAQETHVGGVNTLWRWLAMCQIWPR